MSRGSVGVPSSARGMLQKHVRTADCTGGSKGAGCMSLAGVLVDKSPQMCDSPRWRLIAYALQLVTSAQMVAV